MRLLYENVSLLCFLELRVCVCVCVCVCAGVHIPDGHITAV